MKTPIQELIEQVKFSRDNQVKNSPEHIAYAISIVYAESLLEKVKEVTIEEENQLKMEIEHIFESGANEKRVFEMVKNFINRRNL